jgi:iron(III) transport system permease protein
VKRQWKMGMVGAGLLGVFALLLIWPLFNVLKGGFYVDGRFTLEYLAGVFRNPVYAEGLLNSLLIACGTTLSTLVISIPLAWLGQRYDFAGKRVVTALLLVPMVLPPFVGVIGFQQIFGQYGTLNALLGLGPIDWLGRGRISGIVLLQSLALYPVVYLNVSSALANIDPAMEEAAENLGSHGWHRFRHITLPLMMPGIFAGGTLVFIWSFTELGTPLMMNFTKCAPVQVYDALKEIGTNPFPYALVVVMLGFSILLYSLSKVLFGRRSFTLQSKGGIVGATARRVGRLQGAVILLPFAVVILAALLPHIGVVLTSFSTPGGWYRSVFPQAFTGANYTEALGHEMTLSAIRNSLLFSSMAVAADILLGVLVAVVVVRSTLRWRGLVDGLAMLPLAVPGLVMAFGYLSVSTTLSNSALVRAHPWLLELVDVRQNPTLLLVLAYSIRRLPYMVRAAVAGLQQTPASLEEAAANLGANPLRVLRRISLPLIMANLVAGALITFAFSMLEVSDSLMLAQKMQYYPITKTIYELFQLIGTGRFIASALGVWAMSFLMVSIVGSSLLLGKRLGALFRV